jgi:hypothetical protein
VLLALPAGGASAASAPACRGAISLDGPAPLVRAIQRILDEDGFAIAGLECQQAAVRALVAHAPASPALALQIADPYGRSSAYKVSDATDAAGLIESWASPPDAPSASSSSTYSYSSRPETLTRRMHWIASADLATSRDRTTWYGSSVTDCAELGVFCVGPRLRLARDDGFSGTSERYRIRRKSLDVTMVEAYPVSYRRLTVMPSAAFGFGWMRSRVVATPRENASSASDFGFRAELSMMFAFHLTASWWLGGEIGASYTPTSSLLSQVGAAPLPGPSSASLRAGLGFQFVL